MTLVAAGMPVWMLIVGGLFFNAKVGRKQVIGVVLSMAGVLLVLSRGEWQRLLAMHLVPGDLFMIAATIAWSFYSWLLTLKKEPKDIRSNWAAFLLAQVVFGVMWSSVFAAGEWAVSSSHIVWSWSLVAALLYVAVGPAIIAFRCWGAGVQRAGPTIAGFFSNLTPFFAAIMSSAFLGEMPHLYHVIAFALIVGGIVCSSVHYDQCTHWNLVKSESGPRLLKIRCRRRLFFMAKSKLTNLKGYLLMKLCLSSLLEIVLRIISKWRLILQ